MTAQAIEEILAQNDFESLVGEYVDDNTCDGPDREIGLDDQWAIARDCGLPGVHDPARARKIRELAAAVDQLLLERAAPLEGGPIRYLITSESDPEVIANCYHIAMRWPFSTPLDSVVSSADQQQGGHLAKDDDALQLRALEEAYRAQPNEMEMSFLCAHWATDDGWVAIVGVDGSPYRLLMRDATPFENEEGLLSF